jgi:hypothetical protein
MICLFLIKTLSQSFRSKFYSSNFISGYIKTLYWKILGMRNTIKPPLSTKLVSLGRFPQLWQRLTPYSKNSQFGMTVLLYLIYGKRLPWGQYYHLFLTKKDFAFIFRLSQKWSEWERARVTSRYMSDAKWWWSAIFCIYDWSWPQVMFPFKFQSQNVEWGISSKNTY